MRNIDLSVSQGAIFSDGGKHRYALWRVWSQSKKLLMFCGLNPSTANQIHNDPTITRMMNRAYKEGYGGLLVGNLYSYVSTNPTILIENDNRFNEETDEYLRLMIGLSEKQLCGWGSFIAAKKRAGEVLKMMASPYCVGINSDGQPKHPLYVSYDTPMIKYEGKVRV